MSEVTDYKRQADRTWKKDGKPAERRTGACSCAAPTPMSRNFNKLPQSVQDELHILCVLYTEEVGGIFTILFEPDGGVTLETTAAEEDFLYDEVSSGLLLGEIRRKRRELLESLSLYYRAMVLHENVADFLDEEE